MHAASGASTRRSFRGEGSRRSGAPRPRVDASPGRPGTLRVAGDPGRAPGDAERAEPRRAGLPEAGPDGAGTARLGAEAWVWRGAEGRAPRGDEGKAGAVGTGKDGEGKDGVGSDGVGNDGVGSDGVGSDGVGNDGVGSDGVGSDGVGTGSGGKPAGALARARRRDVARTARFARDGDAVAADGATGTVTTADAGCGTSAWATKTAASATVTATTMSLRPHLRSTPE